MCPRSRNRRSCGQLLAAAVSGGTDFADVIARVEELEEEGVLAKDVATTAQVDVYMKAAEREFANPGQALDLCERMLKAVPLVFRIGS